MKIFVFLLPNKFGFRRVAAFIHTLKRTGFCIFDYKTPQIFCSFLDCLFPFIFFLFFFAAPSRPRRFSFIWQREDVMKRRVLVRHNGAAGCHKGTGRGTSGPRANTHQLKVCETRSTFWKSPSASFYTHLTEKRQQPRGSTAELVNRQLRCA